MSCRAASMLLTVGAAASVLGGCADADPEDFASSPWGPLAVASGPPSGAEALITGTLSVTEACVLLISGGEETLLVWPDQGTTWNGVNQTIEYDDGEHSVVVSDGDEVAFGGGGSSVNEDGLDSSEWVASINWTSAPDPSCLRDVRWSVGDLANAE
jgi:hypothetical protein